MQDRRAVTRHKSFLQGRIYFNNRRSSVDCLIRDISDQGARPKISDAITTPEAVELHIPNKDETYRAKVIWRAHDEMGVTFSPHESLVPSPEGTEPVDLFERVQKLERDLAKLRRIVMEIRAELPNRQPED
jgi:hypothetical protein